jgi:hypothetical protein
LKRFICILAFIFLAIPARPAKRITVGELEDMLRSMEAEKKPDAEMATALKQVELSEELTRETLNKLTANVPGRLTLEQIYVLEALSAFLPPPAAEIPSSPAPDATAQKVLLDKAAGYVANSYAQLPALTSTKTTLRFQDSVEAVASSTGVKGSAKDTTVESSFSNPYQFIHYISATVHPVTIERGSEKKPSEKDPALWGANGYIKIQEPEPNLSDVFKAAQSSGSFQWVRWELVSGRPAAVFSFSAPKQKDGLKIDVCCFPKRTEAGVANFYTANTGRAVGGSEATPGVGGVTGNWQTTMDWNNFKTVAPYHGELFIDPGKGIVLRMIVEAEMKSTDAVQQLDTRIDYGAVTAGTNTYEVPVRSIIDLVDIPGGVSGAAAYSRRTTLFTSEYADFRPEQAK